MVSALFENPLLIAVDKPTGWLSVPSRFGRDDPRPCLGLSLEQELGVQLWPIHRLDEEVSGLILFAKSADAHRLASAWFEKRQVKKLYEAWTEGPAPTSGNSWLWRSTLLRGKKRAYASPHGKPAATSATFIGLRQGSAGEYLSWEVEPHTGRPHQLRYELAHHGFPILGDKLYGSQRAAPGPGIALRCIRLGFAACEKANEMGLPLELKAEPLTEYWQRPPSPIPPEPL